MRFIAHKGNMAGASEYENAPGYIEKALKRFDAEIDLWVRNKKLYLGHDYPKHEITAAFLEKWQTKLWIHCKNRSALDYMVESPLVLNYFYHEKDDYTLTSKGYIWTYPQRMAITHRSVLVVGEDFYGNYDNTWKKYVNEKTYAICGDYL